MNFTLENIKQKTNNILDGYKRRVIICAGTGCVANGSLKVYDALVEQLKRENIDVEVELNKHDDATYVSKSGCQGFCQMGPLLTIMPENILYTKVTVDDVSDIVEKTLKKNEIVDRLLYLEPNTKKHCKTVEDIPFYKKQKRVVLKSCGAVDPECIDEYIANDGYSAAENAVRNMTDEEICKTILDSGLRGRGGGGFPTGKKWDLTRISKNEKKYVICNGDEGDPGAFMDRSVMEGNPHSVIEGMIIAGMAVGANEGYVYVRAEYPLAVERMRKAIIDANKYGVLGDNIFGSDKSFKLHVMEGAGAFVCGEETALISSIEGKRGMPAPKPPYPANKGLWEKPTVINNVETLATVPIILRMGVENFVKIGTESSKGTKTFAVTGHVANTGLIEVPFGTTLREIIFDIAGGVTDNNGKIDPDGFKVVQIGGPSGGCLTSKYLDTPLDFESVKKMGAMIGSGGLVVMNKSTCMVKIANFFMHFICNESCGKCVLCREGTKQMQVLLDDIVKGNGDEQTIELLWELAIAVQQGSLCGLGKTAPNPVISTLVNFGDEYKAHVLDKKCPAGECTDLVNYSIDKDKCKGCTLCAKKCPVGAITGNVKEPHVINTDICIKCGVCESVCKFNAVVKK